ncbi:MAG: DUF2079 domain-containing protein [Actinomycetota bacterium]|nr:DUF2079 domain-containing protein [Actinomycetota bacterium]
MTDRPDRIAVLAIILLTAVAVALGVRTGYRTVDVDEVVFHDTLTAMRDGRGYYPAMRDALVAKEGAAPSQIRSVRPPTLYLVLARFPPPWWRYLVGTVYLATMALAWRLARPLHAYGGPVAVVLSGMWMLGASPVLFLHTELWGVPFLLGGALAMRHERWAAAAAALAVAAGLRELYVLALVIGLVVAPRRRPWLVALGVVAVLALVHADLTRGILSAQGREAGFGASHGLSVRYVLDAIGPSDRPLGWLIGVAGLALGSAGLVARWGQDAAARLLLPFAAVMVPLTVLIGREYWGLVFGPALACFLPAGIDRLVGYRASTGARNCPV